MKGQLIFADEVQLLATKCLRNGGAPSRYEVNFLYYVCPRGQDAASISHHCANTNVMHNFKALTDNFNIKKITQNDN
jgi:hypothetical protein